MGALTFLFGSGQGVRVGLEALTGTGQGSKESPSIGIWVLYISIFAPCNGVNFNVDKGHKK